MAEGWDSGTKETVRKIPLLTVRPIRFSCLLYYGRQSYMK